jgi:DinB superfamily
MREQYLFEMIEKTRKSLLQEVAKLSEEKAKRIPEGFNNNIIWNVGHILLATKVLVFDFAGEPFSLPEDCEKFFAKGTKPSDWQEEPPSLSVLNTLLEEQLNTMLSIFSGKLASSVRENFKGAETVGELLLVNLLHENTHANTIYAMKKILK